MSFRLSRKCSKNPRPQPSNAGIALVSVLWLLMLLSGLAATVAYVARVEALLARRSLDLARMQTAADAAVVNTISGLSDETPARRPPIGMPQPWEFEDVPVTILVSKEAGRIDVNTARDELLLAFLQAEGVRAEDAATLVNELRDWQGGGSGSALRPQIARGATPTLRMNPLETIDELRQLPAWQTPKLDCWLDSLTVYSGQPDVSVSGATPGALAAVNWLETHAPNRPQEPAASSAASPLGQSSVLGEVIRIHASATVGGVSATSEWVGRITGDRSQPMLTMRWDHGTVSGGAARAVDCITNDASLYK